jgi:hypothetical protein
MGYQTIWRIPRDIEIAIAQTEIGQFKKAAAKSAMDAQKAAEAATNSAGIAEKMAEAAQKSKVVIDKIRDNATKDLNDRIADALAAVNKRIDLLSGKMTRLTEGWFHIQSALTSSASPGGYMLAVKNRDPNQNPPILLFGNNVTEQTQWRLVLLDK